MKNRFHSRFRKDLFPEMPETFPAGLLRAAQSAGANPRRVVHVRTVFAWAAAAALIVVCVALFGLGIFARQNRSRREAASAFDYSVVGKWTMTAVEMNGISVDPDMFGADLGVWLEFTDDGGPTHGHDSGKMMLTGVMDGSDSLRQDGTYRVNGTIITAIDEKGEAMEIRYDPETDTLTLEHDYDDGGSFHVVLIFSRTPDAEIPPSLVGKWTRIRQEIADDDGKVWTDPAALPDADESWTEWQSWLVFGKDGRVTLTDCYDPKTGNALHNASKYRLASERDVEIDFGDGYSMQYDRESDTILLYINDRTRYTYARTPDAVIPDAQTPGSAVDAQQQEYKRLEKQYPAYFDLDTEDGLTVYVWQMSSDGYCCALLAGSDNKTDVEIGGMKGTTIEEMLLILNTYETEDNDIDVEVVPFRNPLSSYWYEIDEAYTEKLVWLLNGTPNPAPFLTESSESGETAYQVDDPEHILNVLTDVEVCDVDGDGQLESCRLSFGPTSGLFTVVFTVYRNGTLAYRNTFNMDYGTANFVLLDKGLSLEFVFAKNEPWTVRYLVTIENGVIVLTNMVSGNQVEYWGLDDPQWNMKVTTATAKGRIGGAWYCYDKGLASYPGYDELLLIEFDPDGKHVSFTEDRRHYEGYSWQTDADDPNVLILTNETTGDVRRATLETDAKLRFETDLNARGDRSEWTYYSLPILSAEDLPYGEPANLWQSFISAHLSGTDPAWCNGPLGMFDLDGDGKPELIRLTWDETSRKMTVEAFTNHNRAAYTGYIAPGDFGTNEGELYYTVENVTDPLNLILIDLDPSDGHVNLLVSGDTENGGYIYELHVENGALMCGHVIDGYCFLADSPEQELMLGVKADLFGAKFGYREVRGEALEPVDDRLYADLVGEKIAFVNRETNIGDGTLLHLVRALPCEIDGVPGTLEPDVYIYLYQWNEAMTEIIFCAEDGRWITVHLDGSKPYAVGGIPLTDYFDNAPKG